MNFIRKEEFSMHMIDRNSPCWCGSGLKYKKCHYDFDEKLKMYENKGCIVPEHNMIKTPEQIEGIRAAAKINNACLDLIAQKIKAGMTTEEIDALAYDFITKSGGIPACLGFYGFPKSICTSVNDQVCHGIPDKTVLKSGDIVNVDVTTIYNGYYADASRMFMIGIFKIPG